MSPAVVVAPHPDDEVLGASSILCDGPVTVVHVSDGVPPWTEVAERTELVDQRRAECGAAWEVLGADVTEVVRLGFDDLAVWQAVPELADALTNVLVGVEPTSVHVPAYQGGHPDHDATFAAALLARRQTGDRHRWQVYGLYGYDDTGHFAFGALDSIRYRGASRSGKTRVELECKAAALRCFTSQLRPGSMLQRWLEAPVGEGGAPMPGGLPTSGETCFYDEELDFARFGVTATAVRATVDLVLEHTGYGRS